MQPWRILWHSLLGFALHALVCQAAWVRKYPCGPLRPDFPSWDSPFWIASFRGTLDSLGDSNELSLSILAVHNTSQFHCEDLDFAGLEASLGFHVLGYPTGHVKHFERKCPLPITDALTPRDGMRFSMYEMVYMFDHNHRLQTLVADFRFKTQNGNELDCGVAKITPDIGTAASAAFTYLPAGVMALVGITSWQTHLSGLGTNPFFEYGSAMASQGPVWETILDIAAYLRYLQFAFLSASLTMEYPGFYQPIVSKLAWSSLLYWRGPIDNGFTYKGIEHGMYVSNASYGLEYMVQMLGFPRMPDIMLDAFVNLFILAFAIFFIISVSYMVTCRPTQGASWRSIARSAGIMTVGMTLSFFSIPLLSYMSYELILIGYLPNYRVALVGLMVLVIVGANYVVANRFERQGPGTRDASSEEFHHQERHSFDLGHLLRYLSHYLPHSIPLLQAIFIGGLQDWSVAQLSILIGTEIVLLIHTGLQQGTRFLWSKTAWCSIFRLSTVLLAITFKYPVSEATKQWAGYSMLGLHGVVILPGFFFSAVWQLYRASRKKPGETQAYSLNSGSSHSNVAPTLNLDDISSHFVNTNGEFRRNNNLQAPEKGFGELGSFAHPGLSNTPLRLHNIDPRASSFPTTPTDREQQVGDFSAFYRKPRSRNATPIPQLDFSSQASGSSSSTRSPSSESDKEHSSTGLHSPSYSEERLEAFIEMPVRPDVDYSVRESDLFYGKPISEPVPSGVAANIENGESSRSTFYDDWASRIPTRLKRPKQKKEKGFQVVRPPRPT